MPAIITSNMRLYTANQFIGGFGAQNNNMFLFIARTLPWTNDNTPPMPQDCVDDLVGAYTSMMSLKQIGSSDVCLVIPRYDWSAGTVYSQYYSNTDLFSIQNGAIQFYVLTDDLNVYKCLYNNNGAASTIKPTGTSTHNTTLADGYQWKYMYTVRSADVLKFLTTEWVPVRTLTNDDGSSQWAVQAAAIPGTIDRIDLLTQGSQYTQVPTVHIVGDGTGATAVATIGNGNVLSIIVTSTGRNYTYANVTLVGGGTGANGATASAVVSPSLGHGADPISELGGFYAMVNSVLVYDENGTFSTQNDYRQIGILQNPYLNETNTLATGTDYCQSVNLVFGQISGTTFNADELVTGSASGATGIVLDWNSTTSVLRLVQTVGNFVPGETIVGANASGVLQTVTGNVVSATAVSVTLPNSTSTVNNIYVGQTMKILSGTGAGQIVIVTAYDGSSHSATVNPPFTTTPDTTSVFSIANIGSPAIEPFSGKILYLENRRPVIRSSNQQENIKLVIEF